METSEIDASSEMWSFVSQTFANISLIYDLVSSHNGTKANDEGVHFFYDNPAKLGIITGLFMTCLADFRTAKTKLDVDLHSKLKSMAIALINLMIFLLFAPAIISMLVILFVYRKIVQLALTITLREEFAGLLEGTDCVWSLENSTALSVINILGVFEKNNTETSEDFLTDFRNVIEKRLLSSRFEKLNWLREKKYGYHYWRRGQKVRIEEHVRWMDEDAAHEKCDDSCYQVQNYFLNAVLAKFTNKQLPRQHSTSWEILIDRNCMKSSSKRVEKLEDGLEKFEEKNIRHKIIIPVLFRVHHCVGDGVALLRVLLESIADSKCEIIIEHAPLDNDVKTISVPRIRQNLPFMGAIENENEFLGSEKYLLNASMPFAMRIPLRTIAKSILGYITTRLKILKIQIMEYSWNCLAENIVEKASKRIEEISKKISAVISAPNCLVQQALRSMDNSALHGPALSGEKLLSCWMESDSYDSRNPNLMEKIRYIKNATGSRFSDVVLAALSKNLYRYFSKIGEAAPKTMTVVIPARITAPSKRLNLQNDFSVGLLTLRCNGENDDLTDNHVTENTRLIEHINDVARSSEKLRKDSDYQINFYVMKWLSALLPECLLRPVLESHSTLVFSNLPGPQEVFIIEHRLKNIAFWIPHRGKTGLGCSLLTYGGKVHLTISADTALIQRQSLLDEIVRNTIDDIEKLYDSISPT